MLKIVDKKKLPAKKVSPMSSSGAQGLFGVEEEEGQDNGAMGTDDIMKYIQQNQATEDEDLDLF